MAPPVPTRAGLCVLRTENSHHHPSHTESEWWKAGLSKNIVDRNPIHSMVYIAQTNPRLEETEATDFDPSPSDDWASGT
jgi:hypothetical protein